MYVCYYRHILGRAECDFIDRAGPLQSRNLDHWEQTHGAYRSALLADAERLEDNHHAGGMRPAVRD